MIGAVQITFAVCGAARPSQICRRTRLQKYSIEYMQGKTTKKVNKFFHQREPQFISKEVFIILINKGFAINCRFCLGISENLFEIYRTNSARMLLIML